jgi:hypothetical protein
MAHPGLTPLPPTIHHSSAPLTHLSAHTILSSFLSLAELDPSLRPDSVLSERGPTSTSSAANPNLTLTHLGRIKLGMEGKRARGGVRDHDGAETPEFWGNDGVQRGRKRKREADDGEKTPAKKGKKARGASAAATQNVQIVADGHDAGDPALVSTATAQDGDGWQDRENYELAQDDDEEVDVGNTQRNAGAGGDDDDDVEETVGTAGVDGEVVEADSTEVRKREAKTAVDNDVGVVHKRGGGKVDKAERKRLKKERSKKEKKTARPG